MYKTKSVCRSHFLNTSSHAYTLFHTSCRHSHFLVCMMCSSSSIASCMRLHIHFHSGSLMFLFACTSIAFFTKLKLHTAVFSLVLRAKYTVSLLHNTAHSLLYGAWYLIYPNDCVETYSGRFPAKKYLPGLYSCILRSRVHVPIARQQVPVRLLYRYPATRALPIARLRRKLLDCV